MKQFLGREGGGLAGWRLQLPVHVFFSLTQLGSQSPKINKSNEPPPSHPTTTPHHHPHVKYHPYQTRWQYVWFHRPQQSAPHSPTARTQHQPHPRTSAQGGARQASPFPSLVAGQWLTHTAAAAAAAVVVVAAVAVFGCGERCAGGQDWGVQVGHIHSSPKCTGHRTLENKQILNKWLFGSLWKNVALLIEIHGTTFSTHVFTSLSVMPSTI